MTTIVHGNQSRAAKAIYPLDFEPALLEEVEVEGVDFTHYPPEGGTEITPTIEDISDDGLTVYVAVEGLQDIGTHRIQCVGQTSNDGLSPDFLLVIQVEI